MAIYDRVETLRGPAALLQGANSPGGTMNLVRKRGQQAPTVTITAKAGSWDHYGTQVDAGGPLSADGRLGYRANLAGEKGTAYNEAGVNRWMGSLALEFAFSPSVKWYATGTYEDSNLKHEPFQIYWDSYEGTRLPRPTYDYDKLNIDNSFYKTRTLALATGLNWSFAQGWSAKLTYGFTSKLHHSNKMFISLLNEAGDYEGMAYNFAELDQSHFAQASVMGDIQTGPIRHNIVAAERPLHIHIATTPTGQLEVTNNLQKKVVRTPFSTAGLATLMSRYKMMFNQAGTIHIKQNEDGFSVLLPLIYT
jgi:iron complex outermembrane receptor protein